MAPAQGPLAACLQPLAGLPPPDLTLPALEPVKNRETYRERLETELEEAIWYSAEEPDTLVEPTKTRLHSIHSKQATVITFTNKSPYRVRALWVDFSGNEVVYSVLEPNSTRRYHTYQTHPWIVRELHTGTRMMLSGRPAVVGLSAEQTVEIAAPPKLKWSLETFSCFPESYKASVQSLLLAHKHMEHYEQSAKVPLLPLKVTPPCSPSAAMPCSPRATLAHQGTLLTSPKAPRLSAPAMPTSPAAPSCYTPRTPCAAAAAGSPAESGDAGATSTTSISICSEASHFKATLTVSSPARAVLKQTVNIEVFNNHMGPLAGNTATTVNFGAQLAAAGPSTMDAAPMADQVQQAFTCSSSSSHAGRMEAPARKTVKPRNGLFNSLVHSFKHAFRPTVRHMAGSSSMPSAGPATPTTHITLHLSQLLAGAAEPMEVDEPVPCAWPPVGTHLGHLPSHLLANIAEMAAPEVWQTLEQCPKGRLDIQPTMLACPPKTAEEEAAEQQAAQAAQAAQQQQQQDAAVIDNDIDQPLDLPPLI